ncbi:uncharacterized protein ASPGLDRAFT_1301692 [Aspergillus glaucus CBS 516.65]|uniref:Uncharacterized protein n=1 Tax=Aspergillus glaucus CBS 516.65 TaxID=1160497 RepID=A0A1L9VQ37_ASPGL|nr:hypothetical protein ASPGLDRAFT_1301692 [Aspergillus glaucus CBS 516.65]OJJ86000.1 hypothetical protein ASPGLDRAFT_1301692 [Aspergillus glaucus CBS 516.65]
MGSLESSRLLLVFAIPGERDCAAARASRPGSTSIRPGNWLLVVCIVLSEPSDGSAGRILANCQARVLSQGPWASVAAL